MTYLKRRGIVRTRAVEDAMLKVPRHLFVPSAHAAHAYEDHPLEIGAGQTISAPHMVAMMVEYLDLGPGQKVLEVGGGSGYHAAVAAEAMGPEGQVYSVERIRVLAERARENVAACGLSDRITVVVGDGSQGLPEHAPYDRIFVSCAAPAAPPPILEQLADGGKLLIPVGARWCSTLMLYEKAAGKLKAREYGGCVFVPLLGEHGFRS